MEKIELESLVTVEMLEIIRQQEKRYESDLNLEKAILRDRIRNNESLIEMQTKLADEQAEREMKAQVEAEKI